MPGEKNTPLWTFQGGLVYSNTGLKRNYDSIGLGSQLACNRDALSAHCACFDFSWFSIKNGILSTCGLLVQDARCVEHRSTKTSSKCQATEPNAPQEQERLTSPFVARQGASLPYVSASGSVKQTERQRGSETAHPAVVRNNGLLRKTARART